MCSQLVSIPVDCLLAYVQSGYAHKGIKICCIRYAKRRMRIKINELTHIYETKFKEGKGNKYAELNFKPIFESADFFMQEANKKKDIYNSLPMHSI